MAPSLESLWRDAQHAHLAGDMARVQRSLRAAIDIAPQFGDAYFELANTLSAVGRTQEAVLGYRAALRTGTVGDVPMAHNNLGNTLADIGDLEAATREYKRGLRLAPTFTYLHNGLANVFTSQSRNAEAAATLARAIRVRPTAHYAYYNLGNALRRMKRFPEAEAAFVSAIRAVPDDGRYSQGLGQLCHETKRLSEAVAFYAAAEDQLASKGWARSAPLERDHASALREAKRYDEAVHRAHEAQRLEPDGVAGLSTLTTVLRDAMRLEEAAVYHQREALADVRTAAATATEADKAAVVMAYAAQAARARHRIMGRLVLFCRPSYSGERPDVPGSWAWGPRAKERGIGGSESAVISISRELAALGWAVEVYANPPSEDIGVDDAGVLWLPYWSYGTLEPPGRGNSAPVHVFIAWRFAEALAVGAEAWRRYLWLHDEVRPETVPRAALPLLKGGGIFVLSSFHRSQLPEYAQRLALLTANGLDASALADGANANDRFIYASTPSAGLHLLLSMWPRVRSAIKTARLDVYYGFWPYAMWNEQPHLIKLRELIEPLLEQPGVHYHGMRSEVELAAAYAAAGFYVYPTDKAETSGIALMKAQACGCVPVTSGQPISALPETCGEFDLGATGRSGFIGQDLQWQEDFLRALLAAAQRPSSELTAFRVRMKGSARRRFSWSSVAKQWTSFFNQSDDVQTITNDEPASVPRRTPLPSSLIPSPRSTSQPSWSAPSPVPEGPPPSPPPLPRSRTRRKGSGHTVFLEVGLGVQAEEVLVAHLGDEAAATEAERTATLLEQLHDQRARRLQLEKRVIDLSQNAGDICFCGDGLWIESHPRADS